MKTEYTPTVEDIFHLKRALHQRLRRQPVLWVFIAGPVVVASGATLMALTGAWLWWALVAFSAGLSVLTWVALRRISVTRPQVEREYGERAWLRTPYQVEITDEGVSYAHGPYASQSKWAAIESLVETVHHLILIEKRSPAALAYGLAKRELDASGGTDAWKRFISERLRGATRTQAA